MISALLLAALIGTWSPAAAGLDPMPGTDLWRAAGISRAEGPRAAPPLELEDLAGQRTGLRQLRGRIVLVYFWGSW
jgi:cytochrome oxidase Cu insertion factor (SCO1/SenC/PrrC family)